MKIAFIAIFGLALLPDAQGSAGPPQREKSTADNAEPAKEPTRPLWKFEADFLNRRREWNTKDLEAVRRLAQENLKNRNLLLDGAVALAAVGNHDAALAVLDTLVKGFPEETVTSEGGKNPLNLEMRDAAFAYALRYHLKRTPEDFLRARKLLLAFADAMSEWPLMVNRSAPASDPGNWISQDSSTIYHQFASGGLWGRWYHLDLMGSYPLLRAYDLIFPQLPPEEQAKIGKGIFDFQIGLIGRWPEIYHNTAVYKIDGLIRFGLVLKRPEYIHQAVKLIGDLFYIGFSPDGFWHEPAPSYHRQVASRMTKLFPDLLKGYSDPEGWRHPETGERFDDLDLGKTFGEVIRTIGRSQEKITLPSGFVAALNDTDPDYHFQFPRAKSGPELLGTSGFAILGSGEGADQQQLFLNFDGTHGHEHLDGNAIHWYALGHRVMDETRYRPLKGTDSSRAWSESTYAHQTVVINEENQPWRFLKDQKVFNADDAIRGVVTWPLRRSSAGTSHMGELLLFDGRREDLQVVEVEGKRAYGGLAEIYRRTIVKVDLGGGGGYLADIFRVRGGAVHDYMLHGPLALPHELRLSLPLEPATGTLGPKNAYLGRAVSPRFIDLVGRGKADAPWSATFSAQNAINLTSLLLHPGSVEILSGKAPAINRPGDAPFVAVRNRGGESVFVAIHEVYPVQAGIKGARLLAAPSGADGGVIIEVDLGAFKHRILSTSGPDQAVSVVQGDHEYALSGRLGWLRMEGEKVVQGALWDGLSLRFPGGEIRSAHPALLGQVTGTLRRQAGDEANALIVKGAIPPGLSLTGSTVHLAFGKEHTWSYRIEAIEPGADSTSVIHLEHDPGFQVLPDGLTKMLFHPGWGTRLPVTFRIPLHQAYQH